MGHKDRYKDQGLGFTVKPRRNLDRDLYDVVPGLMFRMLIRDNSVNNTSMWIICRNEPASPGAAHIKDG